MMVVLQYEINGETYTEPANISQDALLDILAIIEDGRQ